LAREYPGTSPYAISREPASFWLPHISILTAAGILKESSDG
jgi:hypothetical protein